MLSTTVIKLRIYLRTHDGENVFVELENEDFEKAATAKANVTDEQVHPIRRMRIDFAFKPVDRRGCRKNPSQSGKKKRPELLF